MAVAQVAGCWGAVAPRPPARERAKEQRSSWLLPAAEDTGALPVLPPVSEREEDLLPPDPAEGKPGVSRAKPQTAVCSPRMKIADWWKSRDAKYLPSEHKAGVVPPAGQNPSVSQHFNRYHPEQIPLGPAVKGQLLGIKCFPRIGDVHRLKRTHTVWKSSVHFLYARRSFFGLVSGCPQGLIDVFCFGLFFSCLRELVQLKKCWRVCYVSSHMIFLSHARRITASLGVKLRREQSLPLAGSHSYLPGLLKMSLPIKVTGILKVTCNVVTYASCQQTKQRAGTSLPVLLQGFFSCVYSSSPASGSGRFRGVIRPGRPTGLQ